MFSSALSTYCRKLWGDKCRKHGTRSNSVYHDVINDLHIHASRFHALNFRYDALLSQNEQLKKQIIVIDCAMKQKQKEVCLKLYSLLKIGLQWFPFSDTSRHTCRFIFLGIQWIKDRTTLMSTCVTKWKPNIADAWCPILIAPSTCFKHTF